MSELDLTRYPHVKTERMRELEAFEAAGWGCVPQRLIPADWRERMPSGSYLQYMKDEDEVPERIDRMTEFGTDSLWSKRAV